MNGAPNPFRRLAPEPFSWEYFGCLKSEVTGLPIWGDYNSAFGIVCVSFYAVVEKISIAEQIGSAD